MFVFNYFGVCFQLTEGILKDIKNKTVFTTGQVAKLCRVAPRTVSKWFDSGRLLGYRIPGSADRRITREALVKFMQQHSIPLAELDDVPAEPGVVDRNRSLAIAIINVKLFAENGSYDRDALKSDCLMVALTYSNLTIGTQTDLTSPRGLVAATA